MIFGCEIKPSHKHKSVLSLREGFTRLVVKTYVKANHTKIPGYDSSKPPVHILDLDANNLYGKAMQDYLPYEGFRWMTGCELMEELIMKIAPDADEGCLWSAL